MDGWIRIGTKLDNKQLGQDLKALERQLKSEEKKQESLMTRKVKVEADLTAYNKDMARLDQQLTQDLAQSMTDEQAQFSFGVYDIGVDSVNQKYAKQLNTLNQINAEMNESVANQKELEIKVEKTNKDLSKQQSLSNAGSKGFTSVNNSVRRLALSVFSLGTAYSLISRASSSYLQQDLELANKLESVWVGLGAMIAPIIEIVAEGTLLVLGYLNEFIKALTGIDFIANANAKALENQASAQAKLNNELYGFDEINKQQDTSSSSTGVSGGDFTGIEIPELDMSIVKGLQDLAYWLKENWYWIEKVAVALGIAFGVSKIAGLVSGIGKIGSALGGTSGLLPLLTLIAAAWTIYLYIDGYNKIKSSLEDLDKQLDNLNDSSDSATEKAKEYNTEVKKIIDTNEATTKSLNEYSETMLRSVKASEENLENIKNTEVNILGLKFGTEKMTEALKQNIETLNVETDSLWAVYEAQGMTTEQTKNFRDFIGELIKEMESLGLNTDDLQGKYDQLTVATINAENEQRLLAYNLNETITNMQNAGIEVDEYGVHIDNLKEQYKNITGQDWNAVLELSVKDNATQETKNIFDNIKNSISGIYAGIGGALAGVNSYLGFARGGIVTQPTRALIGEAGYPEAVVPMTSDYLGTLAQAIGQYMGGSSGGSTNVYLNGRLIQRELSKQSDDLNFAGNR